MCIRDRDSTIGSETQAWIYNAGFSYPGSTNGWVQEFVAPTHHLAGATGGWGFAGLPVQGEMGLQEYDPQTGLFDDIVCVPVPQSEDDSNGGGNPVPD